MAAMDTRQSLIYNAIDNEMEAIREAYYKSLKPIIKEMVLALNVDCSATQMGFGLSGIDNDKDESKEFVEFQYFINSLSDDFGIEFLFWVDNGVLIFHDEQ